MQEARFLLSAGNKSQFIRTDKPIIAICGKSNVGKSSFINMLANRKKLAKVSKDPGRTRLVNFFDFGSFILADLPGYGYARVSQSEKEKWGRLLDDFFAEKGYIKHVFALVDVRHAPTADDLQLIEYLTYHIIPFTVIATKADKVSRAKALKGVTTIAASFKCGRDDIIITSSQTRSGLAEVFQKINDVISL